MTRDSELDPDDWDAFRTQARAALDSMIDHLSTLRERPVWVAAPPEIRACFERNLPEKGSSLEEALEEFDRTIKPYATGNGHPAFMGWVHGAGTPVGMVAEMLAAGLNANCGGRNHIGIEVEHQITRWMCQAFGFPETAAGLFVTGTSIANFLALVVARHRLLGDEVRRAGVPSTISLRAYTSDAAHGCIAQALELAGLGSENLRRAPCHPDGTVQIEALRSMIAQEVQDRDGAPSVLSSIRSLYPRLRHVFADGGYAGDKLRKALKGKGEWTIEIVKRSDAAKGFVLPFFFAISRFFAALIAASGEICFL